LFSILRVFLDLKKRPTSSGGAADLVDIKTVGEVNPEGFTESLDAAETIIPSLLVINVAREKECVADPFGGRLRRDLERTEEELRAVISRRGVINCSEFEFVQPKFILPFW